MENTLKKELGFEQLIKANETIGKFLDFKPEIEWMVGTEESSCFHPAQLGYSCPPEQKAYAEKWLNEQKEKYPDGWVIQEGNKVVKREYYPRFHDDWNVLMKAVQKLRDKGINTGLSTDINRVWKLVKQNCS